VSRLGFPLNGEEGKGVVLEVNADGSEFNESVMNLEAPDAGAGEEEGVGGAGRLHGGRECHVLHSYRGYGRKCHCHCY